MSKGILAFGIISLFILSALAPISIGINIKETPMNSDKNGQSNGLMDSAWPKYSCDNRNTGRSPYGPSGNHLVEKWKVELDDRVWSSPSPIISKDGTIYITSGTITGVLHAISPDGILKWTYEGVPEFCTPTLAEDGAIYLKSRGGKFFAINQDGTMKWSLSLGEAESSPAIDDDGIIYVGGGKSLYAIYPNSTIKWQFITNGSTIRTSPAIDNNTVYIASYGEGVLYALFSNNGTLKWKIIINEDTGDCWSSPVIGDNGNIYILGGFKLWCISRDGEKIWMTMTSRLGGPTVGYDGTIYVYLAFSSISAYNPDGTLKWDKELGCTSRATIASNGMIYIGGWSLISNCWGETGRLIQLSQDGKVLSSCEISCDIPYDYSHIFASPVIAEDGTIYVASNFKNGEDTGYLHAFEVIDIENEPPEKPKVTGKRFYLPFISNTYSAVSTDPDGDDVCYYFDWGEGTGSWTSYVPSGNIGTASHYWEVIDLWMEITVIALDAYGGMSDWSVFHLFIPRNKMFDGSIFLRFFDMFPILQRILELMR